MGAQFSLQFCITEWLALFFSRDKSNSVLVAFMSYLSWLLNF